MTLWQRLKFAWFVWQATGRRGLIEWQMAVPGTSVEVRMVKR